MLEGGKMSVAAVLEHPATDTTKGYFGMQGNSTCLDCGTVLEQPVRGRQRVRCPECQRIDRNRRRTAQRFCQYCSGPIPLGSRAAAFCPEHRTYRSRHPERPAKDLAPLVCPTCGMTFTKRKRKPTTRYCSKSCANTQTSKRRNWRPKPPSEAAITARAIARELAAPVEIMCSLNWRRCGDCGVEWLANHGVGSKRCQPCQRIHKKALALASASAFYWNVAKERDKRGLHELACSQCGKAFVGRKNELFCGSRCAHRAHARVRRVRERGGQRERVSVEAVYQRGGYRCGICKGKLAMAESVPHPKAPTIDHILPVADGGGHTMANLRGAHFACNSKRGNRGAAQLVML